MTIMESTKGAVIMLVLVATILRESAGDTRYYVKMRTNTTDPFKFMGVESARISQNRTTADGVTRAASQDEKSRSTFRLEDETMIRERLKANHERRNSFVESSTFDPDVLNKFLDDYANKIKSTTQKNHDSPFRVERPVTQQSTVDEVDEGQQIFTTENNSGANETMKNAVNSTLEHTGLNPQDLNDTLKRNKYFGGNSNDDRNGWVTLDAIPWSKSKISKWQANPSSQRPWPEMKIWEKPNSGKPWNSEFSSRPSYPNNGPWYETSKPSRPDYQQDRPSSPSPVSNRPSYFDDRFDDNPGQAQKWPPERPSSSWEKFPSSQSYRPNTDIITDDRPSNFPNSWDKYGQTSNKPTHSYNDDRDRFTINNNNNYNQNFNNNNKNKHQQQAEPHDWRDHQNDYPSKFDLMKDKPTIHWGPNSDKGQYSPGRPHTSHYQYTPEHPPSHPSTGDGQWVLLSTNHGYSKSRQRSIKFDALNGNSMIVQKLLNVTKPARLTKQENDGTIAVMTSKRQVRLTVLPSINGTNTTTSHGGLLEVERTFKTVDQSQKEYEAGKLAAASVPVKKRPLRQTVAGRPSNAAVIAAVGAGMLPATMAMMIPIMLGRKKRSVDVATRVRRISRPYEFIEGSSGLRAKIEGKRKKISWLYRAM